MHTKVLISPTGGMKNDTMAAIASTMNATAIIVNSFVVISLFIILDYFL